MTLEPTAEEIRAALARHGVTLDPADVEEIRPRLASLLRRLDRLAESVDPGPAA
jgi:hypothetical protein